MVIRDPEVRNQSTEMEKQLWETEWQKVVSLGEEHGQKMSQFQQGGEKSQADPAAEVQIERGQPLEELWLSSACLVQSLNLPIVGRLEAAVRGTQAQGRERQRAQPSGHQVPGPT